MEHLNHAPDHLSDLIKEKRLAFKVEADELDGTRVTFFSDSIIVLVNIHELVGCHFHHVALRGGLMRFDFFRVVMVLFSAFKLCPQVVQTLFLRLIQSSPIHLVDSFIADVIYGSWWMYGSLFFIFIFDIRLPEDLFYPRCDLLDHLLFRLFFFLLFFSLVTRWCQKV